ncbi:MAG: HD domain-containing phosphohydrolase, partial [bacterium]
MSHENTKGQQATTTQGQQAKKIKGLRVTVLQLDKTMQIEAYTGFSKKYKPVSEIVVKWLQLNFKGTRATIQRSGQRQSIVIEKMQTGDELLALHSFPPSKKHLTIVTEGLIKDLKRNGFLQFLVQPRRRVLSQKLQQKQAAVHEANQLVKKVKEGAVVREGATSTMEQVFENTRRNKVALAEIEGTVEHIALNSLSDAMNVLAGLKKSDQTYGHCIDVGAIFQSVYSRILQRTKRPNVFRDEKQSLLAAFLHDVGKAKIPREILDSRTPFANDSKEMQIMRLHPVHGANLLSKMDMPVHTIKMAHYHHVKVDTTIISSYPKEVSYADVPWETRLISIIDSYQALVGRRSYKKPWPPPATIRYLEAMIGMEYDEKVWLEFYQIMGPYPVGSVVKLNDGSLGFVMHVPDTEPDRPRVTV